MRRAGRRRSRRGPAYVDAEEVTCFAGFIGAIDPDIPCALLALFSRARTELLETLSHDMGSPLQWRGAFLRIFSPVRTTPVWAEFACPPLTTCNVPRDRIGHLIGQALMPEGDASPLWGREIPIEPDLIVRDTTGPAPGPRR